MSSYPPVLDPEKVGDYPPQAKAGGGYVWDAVLEYRVWCAPRLGADDIENGHDYYYVFESGEEALAFASQTKGAKEPLALILQREYLDEPETGTFVHVRQERVAEWPLDFLSRPKRTERTIPDFLAEDAPANRFEILRGQA